VVERKLEVALAAWEIGRQASGFGARVGGLGVVVQELPLELLRAAASRHLGLSVTTLSPCFSWYDRSQMALLCDDLPVELDGQRFHFQALSKTFTEELELASGPLRLRQRMVYFWDPAQLAWTAPGAIYPEDPWTAARLYSAVSQAMAAWLARGRPQLLHMHDYHVGLVPFFMTSDRLAQVPVHLTIHNASYQGAVPLQGGGFETLDRLGLDGPSLFHSHFEHRGRLNLLKAAVLQVHRCGGRITTVSGDLEGSWGYAAELRATRELLWSQATQQVGGVPRQVFQPNGGLDLLEKIPIAGITNGLADKNRPELLAELRAGHLASLQSRRPGQPLFRNPEVQRSMLARDHDFDAQRLQVKARLKRLLLLECFHREPAADDPPVLAVVGRLVHQKHLDLLLHVVDPVLEQEPEARFVVLASATDQEGREQQRAFAALADRLPSRVFYEDGFNQPLARLMLAGADFALVPSRFEPCGLVDYEAALLGTVVIARRTGGLAKMQGRGYLYDWLDLGDAAGEARAFLACILQALDRFRNRREEHGRLQQAAMAVDASWAASAGRYLDLYLQSFDALRWQGMRRQALSDFASSLGPDRDRFLRFFRPALEPYADPLDWQLLETLRDGD